MDNVLILDCGSQYTQLIARRIRELKVHTAILPWDTEISRIRKENPSCIVISGGPQSVLDVGSATVPEDIFTMGIPVLGLCYGMQLIAKLLGGKVVSGTSREYGRTAISLEKEDHPLFYDLPEAFEVWMSHGDHIDLLPDGMDLLAVTSDGIPAAIGSSDGMLTGLQFHPEVMHTQNGMEILSNFLFRVVKCKGDWDIGNLVTDLRTQIKEITGNASVICGLSGGVDSTVAAVLTNEAVDGKLECIFVNNGLLRKNEAESVLENYKKLNLKVHYVDASDAFLRALQGVTDPETKRKRIGETFIRVFEKEAEKFEQAKWLLQGTLYPDVIESGKIGKGSVVIKSHHNVGGLPEDMNLDVLEPLKDLFKDEVRKMGKILHIPDDILTRHPFPGPGLAVRCLGEITEERLATLREADAIFDEEIRGAGLYESIWQSFCVLLPVRTVGVMGDARTYSEVIALRAVESQDGMTSDWVRLPSDLIDTVSRRICNSIPGVNRVVLDVTSKPPSTIEWE
jgi:GMP synthase (glutamine-hydrolysing)